MSDKKTMVQVENKFRVFALSMIAELAKVEESAKKRKFDLEQFKKYLANEPERENLVADYVRYITFDGKFDFEKTAEQRLADKESLAKAVEGLNL